MGTLATAVDLDVGGFEDVEAAGGQAQPRVTDGRRGRCSVAGRVLRLVVGCGVVVQECIIGGYERGQASPTISFRVDDLSALSMLHADADKAVAAEHATARSGVAC